MKRLIFVGLFLLSTNGFAKESVVSFLSKELKEYQAPLSMSAFFQSYGTDANGLYIELKERVDQDAQSKLNFQELKLFDESLTSRGFEASEEGFSHGVFSPGQMLVFQFQRAEDKQNLFSFTYSLQYVEKGKKPNGTKVYPSIFVEGSLELTCEAGFSDCKIKFMRAYQSGVRWDILPSDRGVNSSAGGGGD